MVDTPTLALHDRHAVEDGARRSRAMGFTGKFAIHPAQVADIHTGFAPTPAEVSWARTVLSGRSATSGATRAGASADKQTATSGEQMVDEAVVRQARRLLGDVVEE